MSRRLVWEFGFVAGAIAAALLARAFLFAVYAIPSESMLPGLEAGDYVLVEKWPYRVAHAKLPIRGELVVFRAPPSGQRTYVKRVIGLPGDHVALRDGVVTVDGKAFPRWRIADFIERVAPNSPCRPGPEARSRREREQDRDICRSPRWREALPESRTIDTLDLGRSDGDAFGPATVPAGRMFLLGDNRDRSADSRFPAREGVGVGFVPVADLVGRARLVLFSVDGSARLADPRSWPGAVRWTRIGMGF